MADATNVLPYFVGSGLSVARQYPDKITASPRIMTLEIVLTIITVFLIGIVSGLSVPRLPFDVPRDALNCPGVLKHLMLEK